MVRPPGIERTVENPRKILFLPLGNGIGHVTRSLALAEEFHEHGHDVTVAMKRKFPFIEKLMLPDIRLIDCIDMYDFVTNRFGPIRHYERNRALDLENIKHALPFGKEDLSKMSRRAKEVEIQDVEIIEEIKPDAIVTDYRFSTDPVVSNTLNPDYGEKIFRISHLLGYPAYHEQVLGRLPWPLDAGRVLVPGVAEMETGGARGRIRRIVRKGLSWRGKGSRSSLKFCGPILWRGWSRYQEASPEPSDILLFFGNTGTEESVIPTLIDKLSSRYKLCCISPYWANSEIGSVPVSLIGSLEKYLRKTSILVCHGGHTTVLEAIMHGVPVVVIAKNLDQLAIGREIERMRLGVLVQKPFHDINLLDLTQAIERIQSDEHIKRSLARYSALLLQQKHGARTAMHYVLNNIAERRQS